MKKKEVKKSGASRNFVIALSVVSIIGFLTIITESLFFWNTSIYQDTLWLVVLGLGLIFETSIREIKSIKKKGLNSDLLGKVTMLVVGSMAIVAGLLSLPQVSLSHPVFLAIKGIIAILAIIFIIVQTWIIE